MKTNNLKGKNMIFSICIFSCIISSVIGCNNIKNKKNEPYINQINKNISVIMTEKDYYMIVNNDGEYIEINKDISVIITEKDYKILINDEECIKIKILNKSIFEMLNNILKPVIIIHNNNSIIIAKGMSMLDSGVPIPCDYIYEIDINKRTVKFDNIDELILRSVKKYGILEN